MRLLPRLAMEGLQTGCHDRADGGSWTRKVPFALDLRRCVRLACERSDRASVLMKDNTMPKKRRPRQRPL
jgi:hypothetical protein